MKSSILLNSEKGMNARLILAVFTSLIDEAIIVALLIWGLPRLGVQLPWWAIALIGIAFVGYAVATYRVGSRILRKKPMPGFTDLTGVVGRTVDKLDHPGYVRVEGELWEARPETGTIEAGVDVVVVGQEGMKLVVRPRVKGS